MSRFVEPVTLTGARWVRLEPLTAAHVDEIASAATDGDPGRLWFTMAPSPDTAEQWVHGMLSQQADDGLTFVVRRLDGTPIGSSSYLNVDGANRRLDAQHLGAHRRYRTGDLIDGFAADAKCHQQSAHL